MEIPSSDDDGQPRAVGPRQGRLLACPLTVSSVKSAAPVAFGDLCRRAVELGASSAVLMHGAAVATAEWVRVKCRYGGCTIAGCLACPPFSPEPSETRRLLDDYATVVLLRLDIARQDADGWLVHSRRLAAIALDLERELFLAGRYRALAIAGGRPCGLAEVCVQPDHCNVRRLVRPGPVGCGIDVFATANAAGWRLSVVPAESEPYYLFALVLVD